MKVVTLKAEPREPQGKSGARRMRREGRLPAVVYGEGEQPRHVAIATREFQRALEHGARVLDLEMEGIGASRVLLKDVQYDALGRKVEHADFLRLHPDHALELQVPLALEGMPAGVAQGGILTVLSDTLAVRCLPRDIPESIPVPLAGLGLGETLHAAAVQLPENVELAADPEQGLVTVLVPRGVKGDEGEAEGEDDEASAAAEDSAD